jgi:hypothetical protein
MPQTKVNYTESDIFPRIWVAGNTNTTSFAAGSPAWAAVQITDMIISGVTVSTNMVAEIHSTVTIDRGVGGSEQDNAIQYRVNGGTWTAMILPIADLVVAATETFNTITIFETLPLTPGNTYDFRVVFTCGVTGVSPTVRGRKMTVKTFLAG